MAFIWLFNHGQVEDGICLDIESIFVLRIISCLHGNTDICADCMCDVTLIRTLVNAGCKFVHEKAVFS